VPALDVLSWIPAALALLAIVILLRVAALADALHAQRLQSEQSLAAARADTAQSRTMLMGLERALSARIADTRQGMEQRLGELTTRIARDQGESRALLEQKLRELAETSARALADIRASVNDQLHQAVEKQMQASFARVLDQFTAVQKAVGDVQAVAAQIGDLKRVFSNVKTRGGWGEAQLRAVLDDIVPDRYIMNARLREGSADMVEFALRMPGRGDDAKLLPIDAKFPLADYERMLDAAEAGDKEAERAARRNLESRFRLEARKIADKYLAPPATTDFAVMYLPSDGLYAEAARIPGLIDELGRTCHVLLMGPSLLPALLRTVRLGYVTLALEEKAGQISRLLGATKQEMLRMDQVLDRLSRNASTMAQTIEDARRRTRAVGARLRGVGGGEEEEGSGELLPESAAGETAPQSAGFL
jgi:DNA recombination protein RmuC